MQNPASGGGPVLTAPVGDSLRHDNPVPPQFAQTESASAGPISAGGQASYADINPEALHASFARLTATGQSAMEYFYSRLFTVSPDTRALFPTAMTSQRERVLSALSQIVASLGDEAAFSGLLDRLGRDHRKFGVSARHYQPFFACLQDTVEHFSGPEWTQQVADSWQALLAVAADRMQAAAEDATAGPPWWVAEIVAHELRAPGVAVLRLQPDQPLPYEAGQYVPVQVTRWPRVWRPYSMATAPRPSGLIELHVRAVPGGLVSNTLAYHSNVGDCVLLGAPAGEMTLADSDRDLLCVAGGTGLAPIKAIIERAIASGASSRKKITLFVGARQRFDLYDLDDLQLLEAARPELQVLPVLSEEPGYPGLTGTLPAVVGAAGLFEDAEAYICGPAAMVSAAAAILAASIPLSQLHYDPIS